MFNAIPPIVQAAIITVGGVVITALTSLKLMLWTKKKEREAVWRNKKIAYYEEFFAAISNIVLHSSEDARRQFATVSNNFHLVASNKVLKYLQRFQDFLDLCKVKDFDQTTHDKLLSRLVWEIRSDLKDRPCRNPNHFKVRLKSIGSSSQTDTGADQSAPEKT